MALRTTADRRPRPSRLLPAPVPAVRRAAGHRAGSTWLPGREPTSEVTRQVRRPVEHDVTSLNGEIALAHPRPQVDQHLGSRSHDQVYVTLGVVQARPRPPVVGTNPTPGGDSTDETEFDADPCPGKSGRIQAPIALPQHGRCIRTLNAGGLQLPVTGPGTYRLNHTRQRGPRRGQSILDGLRCDAERNPLHKPQTLKVSKPRNQQAPGQPRNSALQVVEPPHPVQQFTNDQQRPPVPDETRPDRHRPVTIDRPPVSNGLREPSLAAQHSRTVRSTAAISQQAPVSGWLAWIIVMIRTEDPDTPQRVAAARQPAA